MRRMTQKIKKMSLIMVNNEKILKQKNSLRFGINIKFWLLLAGVAVIAGLVWACGATFSAVAGIYFGYKVLRLVIRLFGLFFAAVFTVVSILILILIISLLIF
jgi:hypothetical protein